MKDRRNKQSGFTLLEFLIAIAIVGIIAALNSQILQQMISGTRQQGRITTGQFEVSLGIEMLRKDIEDAGFGLAETYQYTCGSCIEGTGSPNSAFDFTTGKPPSALSFGDDVAFAGYIPASDYLVIRSTALGMNATAGKWTYITGKRPYVRGDVRFDMRSSPSQNYMVVLQPRTRTNPIARLVMLADNNFGVAYNAAADLPIAYQPNIPDRYIAYGVEDSNPPVRPYTRADYYVRHAASTSPSCAPNTGSLMKAVLASNAAILDQQHLIDCVANMQMTFRIDTDGNNIADMTAGNLNLFGAPFDEDTPLKVRQQVKEVRVYLLAHEGTFDSSFSYGGPQNVFLGDPGPPSIGTVIDLSGFGPDWRHYRWKTYTLSVKPRAFYSN